MIFHCCICGKPYMVAEGAVACVNRCAREAFRTGKFVKKDAPYSEEISSTKYFEINPHSAFATYQLLVDAESVLPRGVFNSLKQQVKEWDKLDEVGQSQLYDMISLMIHKFQKS